MPIHDETASVLSLARNLRAGLGGQPDTVIGTATLALLLDKLIELATPQQNERFSEASTKSVASMLASFESRRP